MENICNIVKSLVIDMIAGRIVWAAATYFMQASLGNQVTAEMLFAEGFFNAIPGIVIQMFVIPLIIYGLKKIHKVK